MATRYQQRTSYYLIHLIEVIRQSASSSPHYQSAEHWEIDYNDLHLEKELGRGAFGIVYRGKWRFQDVAVKLLLNQKLTDKELEDFRKETELMMYEDVVAFNLFQESSSSSKRGAPYRCLPKSTKASVHHHGLH